jgi:non-ribosomal peptide synthetase component F
LDTFSQTQPKIDGLKIQQLTVNQGTARFDIAFNASVTPEGLLCRTEYSTDLFDREAIQQLLRSFQTVLESIIENPDRTIDQLPILSELERSRILETSCGENEPAADLVSVHELFEKRAREIPDTAAVVFENRKLTFRELDERANKLARFLRKQGAGPEKLIGISVERSPEMIVALLGVHKAGAAFVPIDPAYPKDRIAHILSDAAPVLLLTQDSLATSFPAHPAPTVCLDRPAHRRGGAAGAGSFRRGLSAQRLGAVRERARGGPRRVPLPPRASGSVQLTGFGRVARRAARRAAGFQAPLQRTENPTGAISAMTTPSRRTVARTSWAPRLTGQISVSPSAKRVSPSTRHSTRSLAATPSSSRR